MQNKDTYSLWQIMCRENVQRRMLVTKLVVKADEYDLFHLLARVETLKLRSEISCMTVMCFFFSDPPDVPQNLTCIQKMKSGNVSCIWTTGRGTIISTTCKIRLVKQVKSALQGVYRSYDTAQSRDTIKNLINYVTWYFPYAFSGFTVTRTLNIWVLWILEEFVTPPSLSKALYHSLLCRSTSLIAWAQKPQAPTPSSSAI